MKSSLCDIICVGHTSGLTEGSLWFKVLNVKQPQDTEPELYETLQMKRCWLKVVLSSSRTVLPRSSALAPLLSTVLCLPFLTHLIQIKKYWWDSRTLCSADEFQGLELGNTSLYYLTLCVWKTDVSKGVFFSQSATVRHFHSYWSIQHSSSHRISVYL